jgi:hypothetical protein
VPGLASFRDTSQKRRETHNSAARAIEQSMRNWTWIKPAVLVALPVFFPPAPARADVVIGLTTGNTFNTAKPIPFSAFTPNVSPLVFGTNPTATVLGALGGDDVHYYSFFAPAGPAYFDIDGVPVDANGNSLLDTNVALFNSKGTLLAWDDDSPPADPGSLSPSDAFLGVFTIPAAGTYVVAVAQTIDSSSNFNFPDALNFIFSDTLFRPDGAFGGNTLDPAFVTPNDAAYTLSGNGPGPLVPYTLNITISPSSGPPPPPPPTIIPEPGSVALLGAGLLGLVGYFRLRRGGAGAAPVRR